jgi:hypothetical protein
LEKDSGMMERIETIFAIATACLKWAAGEAALDAEVRFGSSVCAFWEAQR